MTPDEANALSVFAINRGEIKRNTTERLDPKCYSNLYQIIRTRLEHSNFMKYKLRDLVTDITGGDWGTDTDIESNTRIKCLVLRATEISNKDNILIREDKAQYRQIDKKKLAAMNIEIGDIIIEKSGGSKDQPVGRVIYIDRAEYNGYPLAYSNFLTKIKINRDLVDPYYLFEYLRFVYEIGLTEVMQNQTNGIRNLIMDEFLDQTVVVPNNSAEIGYRMKKSRLQANKLEEQSKLILEEIKTQLFETLGLDFAEYTPSLYSHNTLGALKEMGIYCNPHSDYFNTIFAQMRSNKFYAGYLEDFIEVNPITSRKDLQNESFVSFVPMSAVKERINEVVYEQKKYSEVKTGFTIFQKGDLLWAKITPCMQNGKSFLSDTMPTKVGFGSTEFHVLRKKRDGICMPYLWMLLSDKNILEAAQGMFGGSAGQQRVPDTFLKKFPIILPPIEIQEKLANKFFDALQKSKQLYEQAEHAWQEAKTQFEKELLN